MKPRELSGWRRAAIILAALAAFAVALLFSLPLFFAPARVAPADVILHLAIDPRSHGDQYVMQLYREGMARSIVCASSQVSWEVYPADFIRAHLLEMGARAEDVSVLRLPFTECGGELLPILAGHVRERGWQRAILVVDPSLTRFGQWRAERYFRAAGLEVTVTFVPEDRAAMLDNWWRTHWKAQRIVLSLMNSSLDLLYARCR